MVGAGAFGVVGAGIGLLAAVPLVLLGQPVPLVAAVLTEAVIVLVTGAVHLDGLADTADALAAPHRTLPNGRATIPVSDRAASPP